VSQRAPAFVRLAAAVCAVAVVYGCGEKPAAPAPIDVDAVGVAYVRLVLALGERDPDSLDSYSGPAAWRADAHAQYRPLGDVQRDAQELIARIAATLKGSRYSGSRIDFLERQLRALVARIDILGGMRRPFAEESRLLFDVDPPPPPDRARVEAARAELERIVPGRGDLTRRIAAFQRRFLVAPERLGAVFSRALAECRAVTRHHIRLPDDERVDVEYVADLPWTALTRYLGGHRSRITVNGSAGFTVDDVLQLACHEGYPGHHVINVLVDDALVQGAHRVELSVEPLFSPQALLSEGAASISPRLAFADEERLGFERATLFGLASIDPRGAETAIEMQRLLATLDGVRADIAGRYVDGVLEFARAAAALEHDALMPYPDPLLKFLNEFRSYAVTYARGPELAAAYLDTHAPSAQAEARWLAYVQLVTIPGQAFDRK
jgi:hypothetical protein